MASERGIHRQDVEFKGKENCRLVNPVHWAPPSSLWIARDQTQCSLITGVNSMLISSMREFQDPDCFRAALRGNNNEILVTGRGKFAAELTQVNLPQVWFQSGRENLPRILI